MACEKRIRISTYNKCSKCNGTGSEPGHAPVTCSACGGKGQVKRVQQIYLVVSSTLFPVKYVMVEALLSVIPARNVGVPGKNVSYIVLK